MDKETFIEKLVRWDDLYFNDGSSPISDTEYDQIKSEFKRLFPDDPYFKKVGHPVKNKFEEISLPFVMGGLDEVGIDDVMKWLEKMKNRMFIASEKLDGNSIMCTWNMQGELVFAASRGDGDNGQNLLKKARHFLPTPKRTNKWVTLRGEVLFEGERHKVLNFKNRRNGVTGLLRRDNIVPQDLSKLSVIFYEVIEPQEFKSEIERLVFIEDTLGFKVPLYKIISSDEIDDRLPHYLSQLLLDWKEGAPYDIDGLVLSVVNSERENVEFPKNKVKFKVNQTSVRTKVLGIEWNVTRTGLVKPVVIVEPVNILGVEVSRPFIFNYTYVENMGIGKGAEVGVTRAGDVIPYITETFVRVEPFIQTHCPCCNTILRKTDKELICDNPLCPEKMVYKVAHFFIEMGCDGISDRTIELLGIKSVEEAYELKEEQVSKLPGFADKKAATIISEFQKVLKVKPEKLLAAFGIPDIGTSISKTLMSRFKFDELFNIKDPEVLGLGPITSRTFIDNINKFKPLYEFLKEKGLTFIEEDISLKSLLGVKFALTGAGPLKRKEYIKLAEAKGAEVKGISKDTNYLVTDDVSTESDKIKQARKFGTSIITYSEFMVMIK